MNSFSLCWHWWSHLSISLLSSIVSSDCLLDKVIRHAPATPIAINKAVAAMTTTAKTRLALFFQGFMSCMIAKPSAYRKPVTWAPSKPAAQSHDCFLRRASKPASQRRKNNVEHTRKKHMTPMLGFVAPCDPRSWESARKVPCRIRSPLEPPLCSKRLWPWPPFPPLPPVPSSRLAADAAALIKSFTLAVISNAQKMEIT
mmetsp:Transcript_89346/g.257720  ORF Transcript_89346/g.257720 Transcript_89346/m.257720 type:complete len:200 (+) Transcript_89346:648-1247(+)